MTYENLLQEADSYGLITKEKNLPVSKGRIKGNKIAIRKDMTTQEKKCVLAEELGHYHTTVGNIVKQTSVADRKQEIRARVWSYNKLIGLSGIVKSYNCGYRSLYDIAEYLDVTEDFLLEAIVYYKSKYGTHAALDNYVIYFEPTIGVFELMK